MKTIKKTLKNINLKHLKKIRKVWSNNTLKQLLRRTRNPSLGDIIT